MTEYNNKEIIEIEDSEELLNLRNELATTNYNVLDVAHIWDNSEEVVEKSAVAIVKAGEESNYEDLMIELVDKANEKMEWLNYDD